MDKEETGTIDLKTHSPYEVELISKIYGELGFRIKSPSQSTLLVDEEALVTLVIKRGIDAVIMSTWGIFITGKGTDDLSVEKLG